VHRPDLACVGELMVDVHVGAPMPPPGGRAHGGITLLPGGSAVTAALAARRAGGTVLVVGRVGDDAGGRLLVDALAQHGVETHVARTPAAPTGICVYAGGAVAAERGANRGVRPQDLPAVLAAGAVLVSGYLLLQPDSAEAGRAALARAEAPWRAVDAASAELVGRGGLEAEGANVVFADAEEARALTGEEDPAAAGRALAERFELAFVKLGARGALACSHGELVRHAESPVDRLVPAGTGDAFAGAALLALARGGDVGAALVAGCRAAAAQAAGSGLGRLRADVFQHSRDPLG
jgi:sugar/nucleoside kinase (ribokinase family)